MVLGVMSAAYLTGPTAAASLVQLTTPRLFLLNERQQLPAGAGASSSAGTAA
jgi:hypothetical protein